MRVQASLNDGAISTLTVEREPSCEAVATFKIDDGVAELYKTWDEYASRVFRAAVKVANTEYVHSVQLFQFSGMEVVLDAEELEQWESENADSEV